MLFRSFSKNLTLNVPHDILLTASAPIVTVSACHQSSAANVNWKEANRRLSYSLHSMASSITSISLSHCSAVHGSPIPSNLSGRSARKFANNLSPFCLGGGGGSTTGGGMGWLIWLPKCFMRCIKTSKTPVGSMPGGIGAPLLCLSLAAPAIVDHVPIGKISIGRSLISAK